MNLAAIRESSRTIFWCYRLLAYRFFNTSDMADIYIYILITYLYARESERFLAFPFFFRCHLRKPESTRSLNFLTFVRRDRRCYDSLRFPHTMSTDILQTLYKTLNTGVHLQKPNYWIWKYCQMNNTMMDFIINVLNLDFV